MALLQQIISGAKSKLSALKPSAVTEFARESPVLTGVTAGVVGASVVGGGLIVAQQIAKKRKKTTKRIRTTSRGTRRRRRRGHIKVIRGRGLGHHEIRHSGKGTKGTKLVRFRANGKWVTFKRKGTSKRRKGYHKTHRRKR